MGLIYNFKPLVIKLDTISFFLNFEGNQMKKIYQFGLVFWILSMIMFCCPDFSAAHGTGIDWSLTALRSLWSFSTRTMSP
jgi:hypothetical protein